MSTDTALIPPAPWTVAKSGVSVDAGKIRIRMESGEWDEKRAIAALIAAAPELVAACEAVVAKGHYDTCSHALAPELECSCPYATASAALARARGEG